MELTLNRVRYHSQGTVAWITLSDSATGNTLSSELLSEFSNALTTSESMPNCRAIVLSAEGEIFTQGIWLPSFRDSYDQPRIDLLRQLQACLLQMRASIVPIICQVTGSVLGGGVGLVAAADIVIASPNATFALPEVNVGMIPATITPFLLRRMSPARLQYLALSSRRFSALEAFQAGLVDEVSENAEVQMAVSIQIRRLLRSSPHALAASKALIGNLEQAALTTQNQLVSAHVDQWLQRPEIAEGIRLVCDGITPSWFGSIERAP